MVKIHELLDQTVKSSIDYKGYLIEFEYYPNRVTLEFLSKNPEAVDQIVQLVKWWSIENDNGEVNIPETAKRLPIQLLTLILEKIVEELSLNRLKNIS